MRYHGYPATLRISWSDELIGGNLELEVRVPMALDNRMVASAWHQNTEFIPFKRELASRLSLMP